MFAKIVLSEKPQTEIKSIPPESLATHRNSRRSSLRPSSVGGYKSDEKRNTWPVIGWPLRHKSRMSGHCLQGGPLMGHIPGKGSRHDHCSLLSCSSCVLTCCCRHRVNFSGLLLWFKGGPDMLASAAWRGCEGDNPKTQINAGSSTTAVVVALDS